jgi:GT2 family glycosyltransferase
VPASPAPTVTVVVPTYGDAEQIEDLVSRLLRQSYPAGRVQVLIVDNHPTPVVRIDDPIVTVLHEPEPGSYRARNLGALHAHGEVLAFTDADCRPDLDWLAAGVACLTAAEDQVVGGAIRVTTQLPPTLAARYELLLAFPQQAYVEHGWAATANVFIRRADLQRVGGFDATLMSNGDREFGHRATAAGLVYRYAPDAIVEHPARTSVRAVLRKVRRTASGQSALACARGGRRQAVHELARNCWPPVGRIRSVAADRSIPLSTRLLLCGLIELVHVATVWAKARHLVSQVAPRS